MFSFPISLLGHALPELTLASSERKTLQNKCCPHSMQSYSVFLFAELGLSVLCDLFLLHNSLHTFPDFWLLCIPELFLITGFLLGQSDSQFSLVFLFSGQQPYQYSPCGSQFPHDFHSFTQWESVSIITKYFIQNLLLQACICYLNSRPVFLMPIGHLCLDFY